MVGTRLPSFMISVHIKLNEFGKQLEAELCQRMSGFELDYSAAEGGVKDYHWSTNSWEEAVKAVESLEPFKQNHNLTLLQAKAVYDETITPIVLKDDRRPHRVNR